MISFSCPAASHPQHTWRAPHCDGAGANLCGNQGLRSTSTPLIGNIALRLRAYLAWDARAERFTNNNEANGYLHYEYRKPWRLEV